MAKHTTEKSQAANVLLTLFLGPLGLLYASPRAALGLILLSIIALFALPIILAENSGDESVAVLGGVFVYMLVVMPIMWVLSLIVGCVKVSKHNQEVIARRENLEQERHQEQLEAIRRTDKGEHWSERDLC